MVRGIDKFREFFTGYEGTLLSRKSGQVGL